MANAKKAIRDEDKATALNNLRESLKPGTTIYFVVTHVARSGMSRSIEFYIPRRGPGRRYDGTRNPDPLVIERITWEMSRVLGYRIDQKNGGLVVGGCGMDMGFHCVYTLGRVLWPHGTRTPHGMRNGEPDSDGGYALKSRQM